MRTLKFFNLPTHLGNSTDLNEVHWTYFCPRFSLPWGWNNSTYHYAIMLFRFTCRIPSVGAACLRSINLRPFSSTPHFASSYSDGLKRKTLVDVNQLYATGKSISMVTAHDYITSKYCEAAQIDITLVGDSLAMTACGYDDTNEIPFDEFLYHVKSVYRGNKSSFLVADIPFGTFEKSHEQAIDTAIKLVKLGKMQAVKMECSGVEQMESLRKVVDIGIPVMGHVGLTPQKHNAMGGFRLQGSSVERAVQIYKECLTLQANGAFSIVLECIPNKLAEFITNKLDIPTIGIGAGPACSGQVLVAADLLGMNNPDVHRAKFVKQYGNQFEESVKAYDQYKQDLLENVYPSADLHGYKIKRDVFEEFKRQANEISK